MYPKTAPRTHTYQYFSQPNISTSQPSGLHSKSKPKFHIFNFKDNINLLFILACLKDVLAFSSYGEVL